MGVAGTLEKGLGQLLFQEGPHAVFLHDYVTKTYPYVSPNIQQVVGYGVEAFHKGGTSFMLKLLHPDDNRLFNTQVFADMLAFLAGLSPREQVHYRFSLNYRLRHPDGDYGCVQQQSVFLHSDAQGRPLSNFGTLTDITAFRADARMILTIEKILADRRAQEVHSHTYYPAQAEGCLTKKELEVLKWMLEGLNSRQIADKMFTSFHTVKTHRGHMLHKTNSRNTAGLIRYALQHGLL
ncbi:helix-turn-helix transcriptional regulator [Cesiribacter andamanensis]|uniref:helix-turn-helix transcriptional regulator n=1 Tax=Cesiribacter andamanensis TaxID=649507 RepID=UPI00034617E1|nr:LuxR C-terminal-related transcriptional regulator [Cesiribacter andamanensis]